MSSEQVYRAEELQAALREVEVLRSKLVETRKLEALGQLAAGVAHEINTPAQYVTDNTLFLRDAFLEITEALSKITGCLVSPEDELGRTVQAELERIDVAYLIEEIPKAFEQSLEGLRHIASIVRAMKDMSHPGSSEKVMCNIREIIETSATVSRNEWKYACDLWTEFEANLPDVPVHRSEMGQVFLNLIVNAAHAVAAKNDNGASGKGEIRIRGRRVGDTAVEVRVSDTGTGIPESVRGRIFEPFFTTKPVGKGTGQGLAIARAVIVELHGGELALETQEGQGTTFLIRLPLSHPSAL